MKNQFIANHWVVYTVSILITIFDFGVLSSLGALFVPMLDKYGASRPATALVRSLMCGMLGFGVISGMIISRFGLRQVSFAGSMLMSSGFIFAYFAKSVFHLYFLISFLAGIGAIHLFMCAVVATGQVFDGRAKLTAVGIQMAGIPIGAACYPYIMQFLSSKYGIDGTFLILGGVYLNNFIVVILYGKTHEVGHLKSHNEALHSHRGANDIYSHRRACILHCQLCLSRIKQELSFVSAPYVMLLCASAIGQSSLDGYLTVFVDMYIWKGFSEARGLSATIPFQICTFIVSVCVGISMQIKWVDSLVIPVTATALGSLGVGILFLSKSYSIAYIGSGLLGVAGAGIISSYAVVVAELVPTEHFGTAFGIVTSGIAVFALATGPIFGAIRDGIQSYAPVLLIIGINHLIAAVLYLTALVWRRMSMHRNCIRSDITSMNSMNSEELL